MAQLEALVWVARLGSVSAAAQHLSLTQSTVSLRLRDLNEAVGRPMFARQGRGLRLTGDGITTLDHATLVLSEVEKLQHRSMQGTISGVVRMGVSEAVAMAGLPRVLEILRERHPLLRLDLAIGTSVDLERDLLAGRLDLALGINLHDDPRLRVLALGIQEAAWVAHPSFGLPERIRPRDLGHIPVLTNPSPSPMYQQTVNWFRTDGLTPQQISVSNSITVVAHMVSAGVGVAILPRRLVDADVVSGRVVALTSEPEIEQSRMSAAYRREDWRPALSTALRTFREVIDELAWLAPDGPGPRPALPDDPFADGDEAPTPTFPAAATPAGDAPPER
ncbi:LysR family transcriptional regulator [Acuticoccus sp. M5D2P5]|uniref:LysR family transcriptional regulator n=1 Tax=Acuticoccus kalidii TaxID=2910977 RepID=UPI001F19711D|nr:LysR family transcriptional regulator [Acuticoccus kalidii]MCF3933605.1 LysR family transcriptional regulator [Acuticoccus kalidii]